MEQAKAAELKLLRSTDSFRRDLKTFLSLFTGTRTQIDSVMRRLLVAGAIEVPEL